MTGKEANKRRNRKTTVAVLSGLIAVCGLCVAIIALIPGFWELIFPKTLMETIRDSTSPPIKVEYFHKYSGNNLFTFLPDVSPSKIEFGSLEYMSFPMYSRVAYSIINTSNSTVIISNELPVKVIDFQPYSEVAHILVVGAGGGGGFRNFVVDIPTTTNIASVRAIFSEVPGTGATLEDMRDEDEIDFFTLLPGEVEVFSLEIRYDGPGIYTFQPGVEYNDNGNLVQVWSPESITAYLPENLVVWDLPTPPNDDYVQRGKCWYAYPRDEGSNFAKVYECDY